MCGMALSEGLLIYVAAQVPNYTEAKSKEDGEKLKKIRRRKIEKCKKTMQEIVQDLNKYQLQNTER
jgi:hypothetical protein